MTLFAASRAVIRTIRKDGTETSALRQIAEEVPVALSFDGSTEAVMMASPDHLEDFAFGFCLSEGIVEDAGEISAIEIISTGGGIDIQIQLAANRASQLKRRRRAKAGPVGCGLCGVESIEEALAPVADVSSTPLMLTPDDITSAVAALSASQPLNRLTGATHAAGFYVPGAGLLAAREDVGRHNALDKLIGHLARHDMDASEGAIVMTSRLSVELVQKAARAGSPALLAISAPTGLAIEMAEKAGMSLVALIRGADYEIFSRHDRIGSDGFGQFKAAI